MRKLILSFSFVMALSLSLSGQQLSPQIITTAGDISSSNDIVVEWTLGDLVTRSLSFDQIWYTQGFHQPLLELHEVSRPKTTQFRTTTAQPMSLDLSIYPNPAQHRLSLEFNRRLDQPTDLILTTVQGQVVQKFTLSPGEHSYTLDVTELVDGLYLLHINGASNEYQRSYKLLKFNSF